MASVVPRHRSGDERALNKYKHLTPEDEELERKKVILAELEARLADQELELAACRADLNHFETHYLQTVGRRYALLDELRARISEARTRQNPQSPEAREQARRARSQARESAQAVGAEHPEAARPEDTVSPAQPQRSESLDKLFRQAAKLLHPDLTLDGDEKKKRHDLMAEVNDAYTRGDEGWWTPLSRPRTAGFKLLPGRSFWPAVHVGGGPVSERLV
jgi:hypothetical protein